MAGNPFQGAFKLASNTIPNVTGITFDDSAADIVSRVVGQGVDKHYVGTRNITGTVNCELALTDVATFETNFKTGTIGAVEIHLFGDTAGNIEITSTDGGIISRSSSGAINGIEALTLNYFLNNVTIAAAA